MELLNYIGHLLSSILVTYAHVFAEAVDAADSGLREPLQQMGISSITQTLMLALVPLLTLIATIKLLGGFARFVMVLSMLGALLRITWPLVDEVGRMV